MIEGGWGFVWAAYGLALTALAVLAVVVIVRLAYWAKRARNPERAP